MISAAMDTAMEFGIWKEEPLSPGYSGLESDQSDVWLLFDDEVAKQTQEPGPKPEPLEELAQSEVSMWLPDSPGESCVASPMAEDTIYTYDRAQLASHLLQKLDEYIKEEPFSYWLEQKVDLPIFPDLPSPTKEDQRPFAAPVATQQHQQVYPTFTPPAPAAVQVPLTAPLAQPLPQTILPLSASAGVPADTQVLLQEFECVFGKVEQSHGALTPPQSPPHAEQTFHRLAPALPSLPAHEDFAADPLTPNPQLIAEVDEIVRNRVEESWGDATAFRPPSPCTSSNSSFSEAAFSPETPDSEGTDDPEWTPEPSSPLQSVPGKVRGRKRTKPYGSTNVEDKRLRKKEQNKNAATRYRMKKKAEVEEILGEEQELRDKNDHLQSKVADLSQEIRYLKNLMREVFKAKGLIK